MKELGRYEQLVIEQDTEGFVLFVANAVGWKKEEIVVYVAQLRRETRNHKYHGYYRQRAVCGRKPE